MSPFRCAHERAIALLVERGQWPHASPADLREHLTTCRTCSELVLVKQALQHERAQTITQPLLPSASAIWWRAQLRKRNQAIARMAKPILGAEIFAMAIAALVAISALAYALRRGIHPSAWLGALHLEALRPDSLANLQSGLGFIVALLAALALVSGLVVYFASEKN